MKVAIVCETWNPLGGGLERYVAQVVPRLERRGHEVHVVAFRNAPGHAHPRLHLVDAPSGRVHRARTLERFLPSLGADVVHDTGVGWTFDVLHPLAGACMANYRRDLASLTPMQRLRRRVRPSWRRWRSEMRLIEQRQYHGSDGLVIACSSIVARDLAALHGVAEERMRRVPNGIDIARFDPAHCAAIRPAARTALGADPRTAVVLFAAHNPRLKGFRPLSRAVARLLRAGVRLRIVAIGGAPDAAMRRDLATLRIAHAFTHLGDVADPLHCFAAADAFALPSYYDAGSLAVLEACACGLPAVTTRHNGVAEHITHGHDGFVIDEADDVVALAASLEHAIAPGARERIGPRARALAVAHDAEHNADGVEAAYRDAVSRRGNRRQA